MKIFFTGSISGHKPGTAQQPATSDDPLFFAAQDLGHESAKSHHITLLRNISSLNVVDHYVFKGAEQFCAQHPSADQRVAEIHLPSSVPLSAPQLPSNLCIDLHYHPDPSGPSSDPGSAIYIGYLAATITALDEADLVITVGDGESIRLVGTLASEKDVPVLAIACFGGSSKEMHEKLYFIYRGVFGKPAAFAALNNPWNPNSASQILTLGESYLARVMDRTKHSYFISYSHMDMVAADSVELQLRRQHRTVYRDDHSVQAGMSLPKSIAAMISRSSTFIAIGSQGYSSSQWCEAEIAYAFEVTGCKRIVYLDTGGSEVPFRLASSLRLNARNREEQRTAVLKLITEEL